MFPSAVFPRYLCLFACVAGCALPVAAATHGHLIDSYGKLPLQFEANQGQANKTVRFLSRGSGYSLYLTASEAVLVLATPSAEGKRHATNAIHDKHIAPMQGDTPALMQSLALRMRLVGAHTASRVSGLDALPGKANYFIGNDRSKWHTNVPLYAKVRYEGVYPGIDLVYYGNQHQLEYDFVVAPGADPKRIMLDFRGAQMIEIDTGGELVLRAAGREVRQHKPIIYQEIDGMRQEVAGSYVRKGRYRVGFTVAAYDKTLPLIIDPILSYSTYLGGSADDSPAAIAVDAAGNAYVVGRTQSSNFPATGGAFQLNVSGGQDVFVSKLNASGSALVYSTYLGGGSSNDFGTGVAVDAVGNAYLTGYTQSPNFPTTRGSFQPILGGAYDAFIAKLNAAGSALLYSTYLGGSSNDFGASIAVDASGNAFVTGQTGSGAATSFPITPRAFQPKFGGGPYDAFVAKLNAAGSALVYSSYLGGGTSAPGGLALDAGSAIAIDGGGNAYVTGSTDANNFPTTPGALQTAYFQNCCEFPPAHAFVTKVNPTGSALVYSTYLGGGNAEIGWGIAVDAAGYAYIAGRTSSVDFPTTPGVLQSHFGGAFQDSFITKLNPAGTALVYSTFLGGTANDSASGIVVDANGNAWVSGSSDSIDFPTTPDAIQRGNGGGTDAFVTKVNATGSALLYSSFIGGNDTDGGGGLALDGMANAYVTGSTRSTNFPTTTGALQRAFGGTGDAFIAKIGFSVRFEENNPSARGSPNWAWVLRGPEVAAFSADRAGSSDVPGATTTFTFTGTAVNWIGLKCNLCGIATVSIDGAAPVTVNTAAPAGPGSQGLASQVVFSASRLAAAKHTLVITVTGNTTSGGAHIAVDAFDVTVSRFEENDAAVTGSPTNAWVLRGADVAAFSAGSAGSSDVAGATATFTFTGTAVSWTGLKCNVCGIATVAIDGATPISVNTAGSATPGSPGLASEPVFTVTGLAAGTTHTLKITVTGTTNSGGAHIAVDAFDVIR